MKQNKENITRSIIKTHLKLLMLQEKIAALEETVARLQADNALQAAEMKILAVSCVKLLFCISAMFTVAIWSVGYLIRVVSNFHIPAIKYIKTPRIRYPRARKHLLYPVLPYQSLHLDILVRKKTLLWSINRKMTLLKLLTLRSKSSPW